VRLLLICLGGAAGTAARYAVGGAAARWLGAEFPYGTLIVNVSGSFLLTTACASGYAWPGSSGAARS
jgi:fluoride exporter